MSDYVIIENYSRLGKMGISRKTLKTLIAKAVSNVAGASVASAVVAVPPSLLPQAANDRAKTSERTRQSTIFMTFLVFMFVSSFSD